MNRAFTNNLFLKKMSVYVAVLVKTLNFIPVFGKCYQCE